MIGLPLPRLYAREIKDVIMIIVPAGICKKKKSLLKGNKFCRTIAPDHMMLPKDQIKKKKKKKKKGRY